MTSGTSHYNWLPEAGAIREMFLARSYLVAYPFLAFGIGLLYSLLLPGLPVGTLAPWVLQFLKPSELAFAIVMGLLLPLVALLNVFLWRHPSCVLPSPSGPGRGVASALFSIIPNAFCCTPFVPTIVALFASGSTLIAISAPIQYFFNAYAWVIYALAALGVWASLRVAAVRFNPSGMSSDKAEPLTEPPSPVGTALYSDPLIRSSRDSSRPAMDSHSHQSSMKLGTTFTMNIGGNSETRLSYGTSTETWHKSWCSSAFRRFGVDCPSNKLLSGL